MMNRKIKIILTVSLCTFSHCFASEKKYDILGATMMLELADLEHAKEGIASKNMRSLLYFSNKVGNNIPVSKREIYIFKQNLAEMIMLSNEDDLEIKRICRLAPPQITEKYFIGSPPFDFFEKKYRMHVDTNYEYHNNLYLLYNKKGRSAPIYSLFINKKWMPFFKDEQKYKSLIFELNKELENWRSMLETK